MADESQSQDGPNEPAQHPQPLDYGTPLPSDSAVKVFSTLAGGIVGVVAVAILGGALLPANLLLGPPPGRRAYWGQIALFLSLAAAAVVGSFLLWRRRPFDRKAWFFAGLLISIGITCLLEGACYARP